MAFSLSLLFFREIVGSTPHRKPSKHILFPPPLFSFFSTKLREKRVTTAEHENKKINFRSNTIAVYPKKIQKIQKYAEEATTDLFFSFEYLLFRKEKGNENRENPFFSLS